MNAGRRFRYLVCALSIATLAVSGAGAGWIIKDAYAGGTSGDSGTGVTPVVPHPIICFGHVDVANGVTRIGSEQGGRIAAVLVRDGHVVDAAAPLVQLDDWHQQSQLRQARKTLEMEWARKEQARLLVELRDVELGLQQTVVEAADNRLVTARERLNEYREKAPPGRVTELTDIIRDLEVARRLEGEKLSQVRLQVEVARQELAQISEAVGTREEQCKQAERAVADCQIKAPFRGKVLRVRARAGERVGPMLPEPLIELCPDQPQIVRAEVAQEFAGRVQLGAVCEITDDCNASSCKWRGQVVRMGDWYTQRRSILEEPLQLNDVRTLECIIQLDPAGAALRIGQRMRVTIKPERFSSHRE